MLFADPEAFAYSFENCAPAIGQLKAIATLLGNVELINDGKDTAPSKRIISLIPEYDGRKSTAGPDIAEYIGLVTIRRECPHFRKWLRTIKGDLGLQTDPEDNDPPMQ
jgi:hypothetical protein